MPTRAGVIEGNQEESRTNDWWADESAQGELNDVAKELGMTSADICEALDVNKVRFFQGSPLDAKRRMRDYARRRRHTLIDRLETPQPEHTEAKTIAWTYMRAPNGAKINITAREGSTAEAIAATVLNLAEAMDMLKEQAGFKIEVW
jgi:hypothetical protein